MKIFSHSGEWEHFRKLQTIVAEDVRRNKRMEYRVEGFQMHHGGGILKLEGIDNPEQARTLSGQQLLVPRERASLPGLDEWYIADLTGLSVLDSTGAVLGEVVSVIETCDDLLEVRRPDGRQFMLPFRKEFVGEPNLEEGKIVLFEEWLADL